VPSQTWYDAHDIYMFTRERKIHRHPVAPDQPEVTLERLYVQSLLLALANPYGFLPSQLRTVLNYLKQASRELGISVVCNLHQIEYAREFGERIVGVSAGRVVFEGGPAELTDEVLSRIYPGLPDPNQASGSPARGDEPAVDVRKFAIEEA